MKHLLTCITALAGLTLLCSSSPALSSLQERADNGDSVAMYRLSMLYEQGTPSLPADSAAALQWLRRSAAAGYAPAMNYLGYCYGSASLRLPANPDSALYWIEKAASAPVPDPKAYNNLGSMLLDGTHGIRKDARKARYWLHKAADAGLPTAAAMLADIYLNGIDTPVDTAAAIPLLEQAAPRIPEASRTLASIILPATDTLSPQATLDTALTYYKKHIFPIAIPLLQRADTAGLPLATAILAQCHAEAIGIPYDYDQALTLYARAAHAGEPHAQFILAELLQQFPDILPYISLTPDYLYQSAARAGITDAATALTPLRP